MTVKFSGEKITYTDGSAHSSTDEVSAAYTPDIIGDGTTISVKDSVNRVFVADDFIDTGLIRRNTANITGNDLVGILIEDITTSFPARNFLFSKHSIAVGKMTETTLDFEQIDSETYDTVTSVSGNMDFDSGTAPAPSVLSRTVDSSMMTILCINHGQSVANYASCDVNTVAQSSIPIFNAVLSGDTQFQCNPTAGYANLFHSDIVFGLITDVDCTFTKISDSSLNGQHVFCLPGKWSSVFFSHTAYEASADSFETITVDGGVKSGDIVFMMTLGPTSTQPTVTIGGTSTATRIITRRGSDSDRERIDIDAVTVGGSYTYTSLLQNIGGDSPYYQPKFITVLRQDEP